jgi:hypothetical protein
VQLACLEYTEAIGHPYFSKDSMDVIFDGLFRQIQVVCYFLIA